jgi:hypothetical protein
MSGATTKLNAGSQHLLSCPMCAVAEALDHWKTTPSLIPPRSVHRQKLGRASRLVHRNNTGVSGVIGSAKSTRSRPRAIICQKIVRATGLRIGSTETVSPRVGGIRSRIAFRATSANAESMGPCLKGKRRFALSSVGPRMRSSVTTLNEAPCEADQAFIAEKPGSNRALFASKSQPYFTSTNCWLPLLLTTRKSGVYRRDLTPS